MGYDLNKKRIFKVIAVNFSVLLLLILINFIFTNLTDVEKLKMTANLMVIGIPVFLLFTGVFGIILVLYLNLRTLFYKSTNILTITDSSIIYDTYINKKIEIKKQDIERIYVTFHVDDYLIRNKYVAIVTRKPIEQLINKKNILKIFRLESFEKCLYINISELNHDPEKVASDIEKLLSIPIKKKYEDSYFGKNIFLGDKL